MDRGAWRATAHGVSKNRKKKKRKKESVTTEHAHTTSNYITGTSHLKSIPVTMVAPCAAREGPLCPGTGHCHPVALVIKRVWDPFSCWGTHNSSSIIGYSKSVCIWKVLYVTVFMHPGGPLAQLLTSASHSSGEQREWAHRGFRACEKSGGRLVYQGEQSFPRKGSRLDRWTSTVLFLVLNQFPSLHPDSGSRDH